MKGRTRALALVLLFVSSTTLAGCTGGATEGSSPDTTTEAQKLLPEWEVGDQWLYTFITPQFGEDSARLVVAEIDESEGLYQLGISSEREAQRHAVINHNPFLGRVTMDGLSVYENGEPQSVFRFPWTAGDSWSFRLLGQDWIASTENIYNGEVTVSATSAEGHSLNYVFSGREGFIKSLLWTDDEGINHLEMNLNQKKTGYTGDVFFYRAGDIHDNLYEENDQEIYDCLLYTSPSPRDATLSRMPSSA